VLYETDHFDKPFMAAKPGLPLLRKLHHAIGIASGFTWRRVYFQQ